jgi:hypothetical protein
MWFLLAAVAVLAGVALLLIERRRAAGRNVRERKRWAAVRGWEFQPVDQVLPSRWRYGSIHMGGPGIARSLVSGEVPTPDGPRTAHAFDHEQGGKVTSVLAAVQVQGVLPAAVELRLPSAPVPDDAGLELLEPVGERYAFVTDAEAVRPLLTPRLVEASDAIGEDVELLWAEDSWALATVPPGASAERIQDLLADLAEVATALEHGQRTHRISQPSK